MGSTLPKKTSNLKFTKIYKKIICRVWDHFAIAYEAFDCVFGFLMKQCVLFYG